MKVEEHARQLLFRLEYHPNSETYGRRLAIVEKAFAEAARELCAEAVELIDVVDGSGGGMLDREPYKSKYANLKDLGAAPKTSKP